MKRRSWPQGDASTPTTPRVAMSHGARGLLELLERQGDAAAAAVRVDLETALAGGNVDAIRAAMDRARAVLPPQPTYAELRAAELAAQVAQVTERAELDRLARELGSSLPDAGDHDAGPSTRTRRAALSVAHAEAADQRRLHSRGDVRRTTTLQQPAVTTPATPPSRGNAGP